MPVRQTTFRRSAGGFRRWRLLLLAAALLLGAGLFVGGEGGLARLRERWRELERVQDELDQLEAETDSLRLVLWLLENDLEYVEKVAREEYGMSRSTEWIFRLPAQPDTVQEDP